jgi:dCMP deaminase
MRKSWSSYFMSIAYEVASRGTCKRKQVGCVIAKDKTIIACGYNGSIRGGTHCTDTDCIIRDGHCIATVHAEVNALISAAKNGVATDGAVLYTTAYPCWSCFKTIVNAGIKTIYYKEKYRPDELVEQHAAQLGINLIDLSTTEE